MIKQVDLYYEKTMLSSFLLYKVHSLEEIDRGQFELLRNHKLPGLFPCTALQMEDEIFLRYDLVPDTNVKQLFTEPATKALLYDCFSQTVETLLAMAEAGLDGDGFVLDPAHIYYDNFSNRLVFIYLPLKNNPFEKVSVKEFFRGILAAAQYDEAEDPHFFVQLHNLLAGGGSDLDLDAFLARLQELNEIQTAAPNQTESNFYSPSGEKVSIKNGIVTSEYSNRTSDKKTGQKLEIEEEVQYKRVTRTELGEHESLLDRAASLGRTSINITPHVTEEEGTTVLGAFSRKQVEEEEGTTALGIQPDSVRPPFLMGKEKIIITKPFYKIGRDPREADYLSKNTAIGRVHAHIITSGGEYFLEDNYSRNGSYLNGVKLAPGAKMKLRHEDKLKLANEEFEFRLF